MLVDVRDMLCAQALAVVARAIGPLAPGQGVDVRVNAPDVTHDLLVWAASRGFEVREIGPGTLHLHRMG